MQELHCKRCSFLLNESAEMLRCFAHVILLAIQVILPATFTFEQGRC